MTEQYSVTGSKVFLEFDDKDPEANSDYVVDFLGVIALGSVLTGSPTVEIESAGNGESPVEMDATDVTLVAAPDSPGSPPNHTAVSFWLTGGTPGVRYRGKIKVDSTAGGSPAPISVLVKRFYVVAQLT